ncbi:hypothetical protein STEG23_032490, partial [Scotinomys teguina]
GETLQPGWRDLAVCSFELWFVYVYYKSMYPESIFVSVYISRSSHLHGYLVLELRKGASLWYYQLAKAKQNAIRLGVNLHIKARRNNPVGRKHSKEQERVSCNPTPNIISPTKNSKFHIHSSHCVSTYFYKINPQVELWDIYPINFIMASMLMFLIDYPV